MVPFALLPITRRRYGAQTVDARFLPVYGAPTDSTIYASWQPPEDTDLESIQGIERGQRVLAVFTPADLRTATQAGSPLPPDELQIEGDWYIVRHVERWRQVMPHTKAIVVLRGELVPETGD